VEWINLAYDADMQRSCEHGNAGQLNLFCNAGTLQKKIRLHAANIKFDT
jgi:hypothetical protein